MIWIHLNGMVVATYIIAGAYRGQKITYAVIFWAIVFINLWPLTVCIFLWGVREAHAEWKRRGRP